MVRPRRWARTTASPNAVPATIWASLSWFPPVKKIPVVFARVVTSSGSSASSRDWGETATTSSAPSERNTVSYSLVTSSPKELALAHRAIRAVEPPARSTKRRRTLVRPSLSSAPPMTTRAPPGTARGGLDGIAAAYRPRWVTVGDGPTSWAAPAAGDGQA